MTKFFKTAAAAVALALAAGGASALTQNVTQFGTGGVTIYEPPGGPVGDGYFDLLLRGTNNSQSGANILTVSADAGERVSIDLAWTYLNLGEAVRGADMDPFYFNLNGVVTKLSNDAEIAKFGFLNFTLNPGEYFSFIIDSVDGLNQAATASIQGEINISAVPVPAAGLMLLAGLGGLAMLRRRGDKAAA